MFAGHASIVALTIRHSHDRGFFPYRGLGLTVPALNGLPGFFAIVIPFLQHACQSYQHGANRQCWQGYHQKQQDPNHVDSPHKGLRASLSPGGGLQMVFLVHNGT